MKVRLKDITKYSNDEPATKTSTIPDWLWKDLFLYERPCEFGHGCFATV